MNIGHDRYSWVVKIVEVDEVEKTLNDLTLGVYEVHSVHMISPASGEAASKPRSMIVARQSDDVRQAIDNSKRKREGFPISPITVAHLTSADITEINKFVATIDDDLTKKHGHARQMFLSNVSQTVRAELIRRYSDAGWKVAIETTSNDPRLQKEVLVVTHPAAVKPTVPSNFVTMSRIPPKIHRKNLLINVG